MRNRSFLWLLPLLIGCATSSSSLTSGTIRSTGMASTSIARAESDHLSDLKQAADSPRKDRDDDQKRERRKEHKHHNSSCSTCNNSPCTCSSSSNGGVLGQFAAQAAFYGLTSPFWVPVTFLGDDYDLTARFPDYPYADDLPGSLVRGSDYEGNTRDWMGNLQLFNVQENRDVDRFGGRLVLDSASRLGLDTETNYWHETFSNGGSDQLWTGDANVVFRFAQSEKAQFRAGVGVNWLADSGSGDLGFNFTYGADWFPRKPWTVSTVFDMGTIGSGTLFHNRTTAGVLLGPIEAFAGYDYFQLGSAKFHGPVAGLGFRF